MPTLFDSIDVGPIQAENRVFMAPMTRARGTKSHFPTPIMADYYRQRASAGLIFTEAIGISQQGLGWPFATGLWLPEQVSGWKVVTNAVHKAGGVVVAQLWHMGRLVHPSLNGDRLPVSASATAAPGLAHTYDGKQPYAQAQELNLDEIDEIIHDYKLAAQNALSAGFDGVQLHAANGYLIDQFMADNTNFRNDKYGGSIENRLRLLAEVTTEISSVVGLERTGVRLSPNVDIQGVCDSNPEVLFTEAVKLLSSIGIAHLELREPTMTSTFGPGFCPPMVPQLRKHFDGVLIVNSDYTLTRAQEVIASGVADAVTFGRAFIANPDLPKRFQRGQVIEKDDMATWYTQTEQGYIDYPVAK